MLSVFRTRINTDKHGLIKLLNWSLDMLVISGQWHILRICLRECESILNKKVEV